MRGVGLGIAKNFEPRRPRSRPRAIDGECRSSLYNKPVQALIMWYRTSLFIRQREEQILHKISIGTGGDNMWQDRHRAGDHWCQ